MTLKKNNCFKNETSFLKKLLFTLLFDHFSVFLSFHVLFLIRKQPGKVSFGYQYHSSKAEHQIIRGNNHWAKKYAYSIGIVDLFQNGIGTQFRS